jgi:two-component system, OmpR family, sensor histidine kinase BaeS
MRGRAVGVRAYLLVAMMTLAVASVGVTGLLIHRGVAGELTENEAQLSAKLQACIFRAVVEAGLVAGGLALLLALPIALHVARPLRRLNQLAARLARGEIVTTGVGVGVGGGRELGQLGKTLESLASGLRRQDTLRRATSADVMHELRGALVGVVGRIEAVQDDVIDRDAGLRGAVDDARRLGRILDDLPALVEAQRPGLLVRNERVDLAAVVRDRVGAYALRFEAASIGLAHVIRPTSVDGDPERLAQVIDNLLANALRYTNAGGHVNVSLTHVAQESVIEISDSGIGIREEHLARVFDRFWRAPDARRRVAEGSGVGLALVRDLVRAQGGQVVVVSQLGTGSRFKVYLPLPPEGQPDEPTGPSAADPMLQVRSEVTLRTASLTSHNAHTTRTRSSQR